MEMVPLMPGRKAQLDDSRHGQAPAEALDEVLADAVEWERQDFEASVEAIRRGYEDMKAGRTRPAEEVHQALRRKHGFPG